MLFHLKNSIGRFFRLGYRYALLFSIQFQRHTTLSFFHTIRAWKHGFLTFNYRLYGLETAGNPLDFVSDYAAIVKLPNIYGNYSKIIDNKLSFPYFMKRYEMPSPDVYAIICNGALSRLDTDDKKLQHQLTDLLTGKGKRLVLKPIEGSHGDGIMILEKSGKDFIVNEERFESSKFSERIAGFSNYIVTEFIHQSDFSARLFPKTVNTIRVITCWDYEQDTPFIAQAVQRIGTSFSYPVDNFKAGYGGLVAPVDLETGMLGKAVQSSINAKISRHSRHPEIDSPIEGITVANWAEIKRSILTYAGKLPFAPCIGWDLVPTDSGFCVIEANSTPGMPVLQVHGPLLASPGIHRFFQYHKIVR